MIANFKVAGKCLVLTGMHFVHGLIPIKQTSHESYKIFEKIDIESSKSEKSKKIKKLIQIELIKRDMDQRKMARELGVSEGAITLAIQRMSTRGKVYEWIKSNLGIDIKQTA
jgi:Trp operon repressor